MIYQGAIKRCLPNYKFPKEFNVTYTKNHWSNLEKCVALFEKIIFPYLRAKKIELGYPQEQFSLTILDTFKGQDNEGIKSLCLENNCELVIVPHNLTNKFKALDVTIRQKAKKFVSNQSNKLYAERVSRQLTNRKSPIDVKVSLKLNDLKTLHAKWVVEMYKYLKEQKQSVIKGFENAGLMEAMMSAQDIYTRCEIPFNDRHRK